jgi:hypothetical protein
VGPSERGGKGVGEPRAGGVRHAGGPRVGSRTPARGEVNRRF